MAELSFCIVGPGALGTLFAARLASAGYAVQLVGRRREVVDLLNSQLITYEVDGVSDDVKIRSCLIEDVNPADIVVMFTKAQDMLAAAEAAYEQMPNAHYLTLQNGLGHGQSLASLVGEASVSYGVTMVPADLREPGNVETHGPARTWIGSMFDAGAEMTEAICVALNVSGFLVDHVDDPEVRVWNKAGFNVSMNGLCALCDGSPGLLHSYPDGQLFAHEIADEVIALADAEGVVIDAEAVHALIDNACMNHTYHKPSMVQDLERNVLTEIEALNGYIISRAKQIGLPVPKTEMIYRLIKIRERAPAFWAERR